MRETSYLINVARGEVCEEEDLFLALKTEKSLVQQLILGGYTLIDQKTVAYQKKSLDHPIFLFIN